jgi:hypothetical protein
MSYYDPVTYNTLFGDPELSNGSHAGGRSMSGP